MFDEPMKHATDQAAAGSSILTLIAYWTGMLSQLAEQLAPILTCIVLLLTITWYAVRLIDRWRGVVPKGADDGD